MEREIGVTSRREVLFGLLAVAVPAIAPIRFDKPQNAPSIQDKFTPADPATVQLQGPLGERCKKNAAAWLSQKSEDELLAGFRNRPGKQAWVGEHAGKWLHAASLAAAYTKDADLRAKLDRVASALIATQQSDGYLGTYADGVHWGMGKEEKWDVWVHKYDLIGLLSYWGLSGAQAALDAARKIGDLLVKTFGRNGSLNLNAHSTHVGMASGSVLEPMVLLARATGEEKYLDFARFIAERWEEEKGPKLISALTETKSVKQTANAKAYEMLSCLSGLCELYRSTGDAKYLTPVGNAWTDIVSNQLLVTGSGSSREHWTENRRFPAEAKDDIAETCVTVSWIQLNLHLLRLTGEARYADELEKTYYNHLTAAQRPDGGAWAYFTAHDGKKPYKNEQNCCTSSGPRGMALLPTFAYMTSEDGIVINAFTPGTAMLRVGGETVVVKQATQYPNSGRIAITVTVPKPMKFTLRLRVPSWSKLDGIKAKPGEYWVLRQTWSKTQTIELDLAVPIRVLKGEGASTGRIAIARGPQVLAVDRLYNPDLGNVAAYAVSEKPELNLSTTYRDPDGLPVYETQVTAMQETEKHKAGEQAVLRLAPFASAGAHDHEFQIWLAMASGN